jgi:hypothetical protein
VNEQPSKRFRSRTVWMGGWMNRNFDGVTLERGVFADAFGSFANYWEYRTALFLSPGAFSDQRTRGGPVVRTERTWSWSGSIDSDSRKRFFFGLSVDIDGDAEGAYEHSAGLSLNYRPSPSLRLSVGPYLSRGHEEHQFVTPGDGGPVFAELEQRSFELATRVDWTLSPRLSFQLFVQPFIASGDYHAPHTLAAARTADYVPYTAPLSEPDFNFRSVRGSAVARWEFRPGSALYVVWNENREDAVPIGDFRFRRDARAIATAPSHDVFLVKVSYWLPL